MGRSSHRVAGVFLGTLLLAPLVGGPVVAAPALVSAHPAAAQGTARPVPRMQRVGAGVGSRRFARYGYGDGYLGAAGAGLATAGFAGDGYAGDYAGGGYGQLPPGAVAPPEPPPIAPLPACPMIIKIGPGLDHPVQTRVIYGAPACR